VGLEVVILCGGRGTRAYPDTEEIPKPLLPVGGMPVVEQVMRIYAAQGHTEFLLAAGYLHVRIEARYTGGRCPTLPAASVRVVDTGIDTPTGERLRRAASCTRGARFFASYADGLADVDLDALTAAHDRSGLLATVTATPLPSQYGTLELSDDLVVRFREKPVLDDQWINGGYFLMERRVLDTWDGADLECETLPRLAERGQLAAYRHTGFWRSLDTFKDRQELDALATQDPPPWLSGGKGGPGAN
jgi:glucose-1-phosphate cytidylyltransferase